MLGILTAMGKEDIKDVVCRFLKSWLMGLGNPDSHGMSQRVSFQFFGLYLLWWES
jgi:hypothetical protein